MSCTKFSRGEYSCTKFSTSSTHHVLSYSKCVHVFCRCWVPLFRSARRRVHSGLHVQLYRSTYGCILTTIVSGRIPLVQCGWRWWRPDVWRHKTYVIKFRFSYFRAAAAAAAAYIRLVYIRWFSNWPPRYLSEFLFGGPVAGPVIYYLFEIFLSGTIMGQFAGPVIFYILEILTTGQSAGQLSKIFSNSWGQFAIGPVATIALDMNYN